MKKSLAIFLTLTICLTIVCGCSNKNVDPTNNSEPTVSTNVNESPTSSNTKPSETISDPSESNKEDVLHILDLKPTGESGEVPELRVNDWWTTTNSFDNISHIKDGTYSCVKNYIGVDHNDWNDVKNIKISDITKSPNTNSYKISVMRPIDAYFAESVMSCTFGEETAAMTVGQAFENGMYKYVLIDALDQYYAAYMNEITGEYDNPVEAILATWGAPSEIYYTDFTYHIAFTFIYETNDNNSIVFTGYEKLEDFENGYRMNFDMIAVYGNNSQAIKDLKTTSDTNIKL